MGLFADQKAFDLIARKSFKLEQAFGDLVKVVNIVRQHFIGFLVAIIHDASNFLVNHALRFLRHVLRACHRMTEEHFFLIVLIGQRPKLVAHAPLGDHGFCHLRRLRNIRRCTRRNLVVAKDQFLGDTSTHSNRQIRIHLFTCDGELIGLRQAHNHAKSPATRNNRCLMDRI